MMETTINSKFSSSLTKKSGSMVESGLKSLPKKRYLIEIFTLSGKKPENIFISKK